MTWWGATLSGRLVDLVLVLAIGAVLIAAARANGRVIDAVAWAWWGLAWSKTWYDVAGLGLEAGWLSPAQRTWMFTHAAPLWYLSAATHLYLLWVLTVDVLLPRWRARRWVRR